MAPRPLQALALALVVGLLAGMGLVLGRELAQTAFRSAEDLEAQTGRPALGQIPRMPVRTRPETIRYLQDKPSSAAAEARRNRRTSLLLADLDRPPRVIMTTSSAPAEGKATLTIALAQNLAGLDRRVRLIEGDIRRRTFDAYFRDARGQGGGRLAAIAGRQALGEAAFRPEGPGFEVPMGERSPVNAADLFPSQSFARLIEQARGLYNRVLIDTPPMLVVPDARVIARPADAAAQVAHRDRTSRAQVEEGMRQLRSLQVPVTGLVLSRIGPRAGAATATAAATDPCRATAKAATRPESGAAQGHAPA